MGSIGDSGTRELPPFPVVDFSKWHHPQDKDDRLAVAKKLIDGCRDAGSVYISGHGVSPELVQEAFDMSKRLFALSDEDKARAAHPPGMNIHRGWTKVGGENATNFSYDGPEAMKKVAAIPEARECFDIGSETHEAISNIWPSEDLLPGFRDTMQKLHRECRKVTMALLGAMGLGLGLKDPDVLVKLHPDNYNHLRLLHSLSVPAKKLESGEVKRMGAHRDFSSIAVIFQDDCGGLQVANPHTNDGGFKDAPPIEGTCVLTTGQTIERWTNGFIKAAPHRVGPPPKADRIEGHERMTRERFSLPYFSDAANSTLIKPFSECIDADHPRQFDPITVEEIFQGGYKNMDYEYDE